MNFLNPVFLLALTAVSIPLLIHILSRRKVPIVPFSTLRFISRSSRRSMRRINLKRLLLLALRMAAVGLLAVAFARPVVKGELASLFPADAPRDVCLLIDRSYSMRLEGEGGSVFSRARRLALEAVGQLSGGDRLKVVSFDGASEIIFSGGYEEETVTRLIGELEPSFGTSDLRSAFENSKTLLGPADGSAKELFIVSDFQRGIVTRKRAASRGDTASDSRDLLPAGEGDERSPLRVFFIRAKVDNPSQSAVVDVKVPRVRLHKGEVVRLGVAMKNFSSASVDFPVEVLIDGERILERAVTLGPDEAREIKVEFPVYKTGFLKGVVRKKRDRLRADDSRYFVLRVQDRVKVLLVSDKSWFYLAQAISPEGGGGDVELLRIGWNELQGRRLMDADVVVIGPPGVVPGGAVELLRRFADGGGKVVVVLAPGTLEVAKALSNHELSVMYEELESGFETVGGPVGEVPFLSPFERDDWNSFLKLRFRSFPLVRGVPAADVRLRYTNGYPFVWVEKHGKGSMVFACLDPEPDSGELVLSPYFLPLVQQLILAAGELYEAERSCLVGESKLWSGPVAGGVTCRMPDGTTVMVERESGMVVDAGSTSSVPGSFRGSVLEAGGYRAGVAGGAGVYRIPPSDSPGYITLYVGDEVVDILAVNCDAVREGDCREMGVDEVASLLGIHSFRVVEGAEDMGRVVSVSREGVELSRFFLLAALVFLIVEVVAAQRERGSE